MKTMPTVAASCALVVALLPPLAVAQGAGKGDDILHYQGADREKRLIEQARKEGTVSLYTSLAPTESQPMEEAFAKKLFTDDRSVSLNNRLLAKAKETATKDKAGLAAKDLKREEWLQLIGE